MKTGVGLAVLLLASVATPALAQFYAGIGAGRVDHKQNRSDWSQGGSVTVFDDIDTGYKIFGGYKFNQYFALEGGYTDLGRYTADISTAGSAGRATVNTDSWNLFGVGMVQPFENVSVFAKLGVSTNSSKMEFVSSGPAYLPYDTGSGRDTSIAWGVGVGYAFVKNVSVRLEYENFGDAGETNNGFATPGKTSDSAPKMWSLSLQYTF